MASRRKANFVEQEDLEEARDKVIMGPERRSHVLDDEAKKLTAYHEAGHTIAMYYTKECDPLHKVTIIQEVVRLVLQCSFPRKIGILNLKKN